MTREEIEMLGLTIHKRLGKKANILWRDAERDLILANILRNHITRAVKFEPTKITPDYKIEANVYYKYISQKLDDEGMIFITEWLRSNINKDILREWLDNRAKSNKKYRITTFYPIGAGDLSHEDDWLFDTKEEAQQFLDEFYKVFPKDNFNINDPYIYTNEAIPEIEEITCPNPYEWLKEQIEKKAVRESKNDETK